MNKKRKQSMFLRYTVITLAFLASGILHTMEPAGRAGEDKVKKLRDLTARRIVEQAQQDDDFLCKTQLFMQQPHNYDLDWVIRLALCNHALHAPLSEGPDPRKNWRYMPNDNEIKILCNSGTKSFVIRHEKKINSTIFSPCGQFVLSGSCDGTIKMWSVLTEDEVNTVNTVKLIGYDSIIKESIESESLGNGSVKFLRWHGDYIVSVHEGSARQSDYVHIWKVSDIIMGGAPCYTHRFRDPLNVISIALSPLEPLLAVIAERSKYNVCITKFTGEVEVMFNKPDLRHIAWSPDGRLLALAERTTGGRKSKVVILDYLKLASADHSSVPLVSFDIDHFLDSLEWREEQGRTFLLGRPLFHWDPYAKIDLSLLCPKRLYNQ